MEIGKIMQRLNESRQADAEGIKTASVNTQQPVRDDLRNALRETLNAIPEQTKTASHGTDAPTENLLKLAQDISAAEEDALAKQAALYGAAMCDGFMTRFAQYEDAANDVAPMKTASAAQPESFEKFAQENPELVKEAVDLGYRQTMDHLVKTAQAEYEQGYNDTMHEVHKLASECYKAGAYTINNVLRSMQNR